MNCYRIWFSLYLIMKILVTGANGLLGQYLIKQLLEKGFHVIATGKGNSRLPFTGSSSYSYYSTDITVPLQVQEVIRNETPEVIVHAAAMTQIDECEQNHSQCELINVHGTAHLLTEAESSCKHFIYISTDFVFDGESGNYQEEDELKPISWYGFTKMQAEAMVQTSELPWTIIRTCLVYGNTIDGTRKNIITWVKESLEQGKHIKVVSDQWRTPTWVEDLAKGIILIIEKNACGVYHLSGKDLLTPYDMAMRTAEVCELDK